MSKIITITSDFGDQFATSQLRAVLASLGFTGQLIENHEVTSFSIFEGAYGIWQLSKFCPVDAVHVGVVDPGVGGERAGIVIKTKNFWFVGPDNGLLWPAANKDGLETVWKIDEKWFGEVSNTFHGRDVFVKAAVLLSIGQPPDKIGCKPIKQIRKLEFIDGQILHTDAFGNIKFFWPEKVRVGEKLFGIDIAKTFSDVPEGQPLILNGSSDLLELAVNQGSAAEHFGLKLGQVIESL